MDTKKLLDFLSTFAPESNALSWDNTGFLIQSHQNCTKILLTIDVTPEVIDECITKGMDFILSYHPVIFKPLKKIDPFYTKIITNGISVYSIHTALDNRMCVYLLGLFNTDEIKEGNGFAIGRNHLKFGELLQKAIFISGQKSLRYVIADDFVEDVFNNGDSSDVNKGKGKQNGNEVFETIFDEIIVAVGAFPHNLLVNINEKTLIITGEMRHHEMLECRRKGCGVILMEHSNSERIYLQEFQKVLKSEEFDVVISDVDKDPVSFYVNT
ncbi:NGG1 interacting factor 3 [Conglomerata obtusa]